MGLRGGPGDANDAKKIRASGVFICGCHALNERGIIVTQDQNAVHLRCHGAANEQDMYSSVCITQGQNVAMVVFIRVASVR